MKLKSKWAAAPGRSVRPVMALICLALFLALQLFASSGTLHRYIHGDADSPGHHCAITMLSHGQVDAPVVPAIFLAFSASLIFLLPLFESAAFSSSDFRLSPSRAPPRR
jgi:hypothetical protein